MFGGAVKATLLADIAYDLLPSVTRKLGCFCRLVPNVAIKPLQAILRFRGQLLLAKHADSSFAGNWEGLLGICRTGRILARSVKQHCPGAPAVPASNCEASSACSNSEAARSAASASTRLRCANCLASNASSDTMPAAAVMLLASSSTLVAALSRFAALAVGFASLISCGSRANSACSSRVSTANARARVRSVVGPIGCTARPASVSVGMILKGVTSVARPAISA